MEKHGGVRHATDYITIWRIRIACRITKSMETHSEYVKLVAFKRQQRLRERAYIAARFKP